MSKRWIWWSLPVLALCSAAPGTARADDLKNQDALVGKIITPDGPDVLNFRGAGLHPIRLRPATPPVAEFDIEFATHATQLSAQAKELIRAHGADFAAAPGDTVRFVIATRGDPGSAPADAEQRAGSVRDYIVKEFGIDPARIEIAAGGAGADTSALPADPLRVHVAKFAQ
jgi:outer membrane protein OmpA-like peptidoglycan-associated protein